MEIEYKNTVKDISESIYQVGNVISRFGSPFLVAGDNAGYYCFVDLSNGRIFTPDCADLKILAEDYSSVGDKLVKAKLIVDYKLDGGTGNDN
ncbi:hypothetical protein [Ligilactobacillus salivarius]|uniref:hypothetical protein n=1 Tax=Ligilactobacillus salivarius TaxID=1624 RepID=UPI0009D982D3|nr:hypothetical protein [Ligilactobacillus salivarius]OQR18439.1 hypothetical protein B6U39_10885 [Ligilactobacillus salivarius]